jgi:hypothetical protein
MFHKAMFHEAVFQKDRARGSNPMSESTITPARRVRHEVRDSLAVMAFSALTSCVVAVLLTLLVRN